MVIIKMVEYINAFIRIILIILRALRQLEREKKFFILFYRFIYIIFFY